MVTTRDKATERYLTIVDDMYALMGYDKELVPASYQGVAKAIEAPPWQMINLKTVLNELGILDSKILYNPLIDGKRRMGKMSVWKLVKTQEEAKRLLNEWVAKGITWEYEQRPGYVAKAPVRRKAAPAPVIVEEPVTIATSEKEETRAIAGPEPEKSFAALASLRKDEPTALVEAARQYANRQSAVEKEYQTLVTMGLAVDREKFFEAISLPRDEFLETISLVLPLISGLQNKNEHLLEQLNAARDKAKGYADLKFNYERLQKRWNERIAEKVGS